MINAFFIFKIKANTATNPVASDYFSRLLKIAILIIDFKQALSLIDWSQVVHRK